MPATYEKIASTTLGSAASSITFSSITGTYTDLRLVFALNTGAGAYVRFNSDTGSNYSNTFLAGNGADALSWRYTNATALYFTDGAESATIPTFTTMDLFSYSGSTFKTVLQTGSGDKNGSGWVHRSVGLYRSTTAISTILITSLGASTFASGTTATLYGIAKA